MILPANAMSLISKTKLPRHAPTRPPVHARTSISSIRSQCARMPHPNALKRQRAHTHAPSRRCASTCQPTHLPQRVNMPTCPPAPMCRRILTCPRANAPTCQYQIAHLPTCPHPNTAPLLWPAHPTATPTILATLTTLSRAMHIKMVQHHLGFQLPAPYPPSLPPFSW